MSIKKNMNLLNGLNTMTETDLNLNNIEESAKHTLEEALMNFKIVKLSLSNLNISNKVEAYAFNNALATNLAMAGELSLKALYLYEQKNSGKSVGELWSDLKNPKKINPSLGNKASGHALDSLLSVLSEPMRTMVNCRVRLLDKDISEKYPDITMIDILAANGIVSGNSFMSSSEYDNDLFSHKDTFVTSRYGGQAYSKPNLEFLYHLAMQLTTIARFFILPPRQATYNLNFSYYANKVPNELVDLYQIKPEYVTDDLINLFVKRGQQKALILRTLLLQYKPQIMNYELTPTYFFYLISAFDFKSIVQVFESVRFLEEEKNSNVLDFLNYCIMSNTIFKEKAENKNAVRIGYINYLGLHKHKILNTGVKLVSGASATISNMPKELEHYENEGEEAKKI